MSTLGARHIHFRVSKGLEILAVVGDIHLHGCREENPSTLLFQDACPYPADGFLLAQVDDKLAVRGEALPAADTVVDLSALVVHQSRIATGIVLRIGLRDIRQILVAGVTHVMRLRHLAGTSLDVHRHGLDGHVLVHGNRACVTDAGLGRRLASVGGVENLV